MSDFGKLDFNISLKPTSAFPLDARCYFESLEAAEAAAATAEEAGSSNTIYYYGQKLVVVDGDTATWYTIQPDNTLKVDGTGGGAADAELSIESTNAVQNKAVATKFAEVDDTIETITGQIGDEVDDQSDLIDQIKIALVNKSAGDSLPEGDYVTREELEELAQNYQPKGDYLTEYQPLKTINGQSLVGYGNIELVGGADGDVPDYVELEYIENKGTQNVNTGYVIHEDDVLTLEYEIPDYSRAVLGNKNLFVGLIEGTNSVTVKVSTYGVAGNDNYKFYVQFGNINSQNKDVGAEAYESMQSGVMSLSKNAFTINGVHILTPTFNSLSNAVLYVPGTSANVRVKSFKVERDGVLIKWYVPMYERASGIASLYEKVEDVFLGEDAVTGIFYYPKSAIGGGSGSVATSAGTPTLTTAQKEAIKALMDDWYNNRDSFFYEYYHSLDAHAGTSCYDSTKGKFKLCCATFVQNIMLGRSVSDYVGKNASTYSPNITKTSVSGFGYSFEFRYRRWLYGKTKKDAEGKISGYYGFTRVNKDSDIGSYSMNTYYDDSYSTLYKQKFNNLNNANDMARELYELGCEIDYADLDIGDIWFTGDQHLGPNISGYNAAAWRNITHVGMVYDVRYVNGKKVYEWIECTNAFGDDIAIEKNKITDEDDFYKFMAYRVTANHVFCARLPVAFGILPNVPSKISTTPTP